MTLIDFSLFKFRYDPFIMIFSGFQDFCIILKIINKRTVRIYHTRYIINIWSNIYRFYSLRFR
jgi:hypothetical protein